ncbi:hypothetical protein [Streptomyces sp. NPDC056361]|uniref:hypothetical protein n=1 Tax=Streptomyces sp. NPDC056361 TaxID=3345795 RepID=UPI0035D87DEC
MDDELDPLQVELDIEAGIQNAIDRCVKEYATPATSPETGGLHLRHPEGTAEVMLDAASAAKQARQVLDSPWAVYQAEDAETTLAVALDLLLTAQELVGDVLDRVVEARHRGDIRDSDGLTHALHTGRRAAVQMYRGGRHELGLVVEALAHTARHYPGRLPRDSHETVAAAAAALGDSARVDDEHHDETADATQVSCGCTLVLDVDGQTWYVSWNDEWAAVLDTGCTDSYVLTEGVDFVELAILPLSVHPHQMVEAIRRHIPSTTATR